MVLVHAAGHDKYAGGDVVVVDGVDHRFCVAVFVLGYVAYLGGLHLFGGFCEACEVGGIDCVGLNGGVLVLE